MLLPEDLAKYDMTPDLQEWHLNEEIITNNNIVVIPMIMVCRKYHDNLTQHLGLQEGLWKEVTVLVNRNK